MADSCSPPQVDDPQLDDLVAERDQELHKLLYSHLDPPRCEYAVDNPAMLPGVVLGATAVSPPVHAMLQEMTQRYVPVPPTSLDRWKRSILLKVHPNFPHRLTAVQQAVQAGRRCLVHGDTQEPDLESVPIDSDTAENALASILAVQGAVEQLMVNALDRAVVITAGPGHTACAKTVRGKAIFNPVAFAAQDLKKRGLSRIAIVDWDAEHGSGTQDIFYHRSNILTLSLHRADPGSFPVGPRGPQHIGKGAGAGRNVNVAWQDGPAGAADVMKVFEDLVLPMLAEFEPEAILVSVGFNSPGVPPACHAFLTSMLLHMDVPVLLVTENCGHSEYAAACLKECLTAMHDMCYTRPTTGSPRPSTEAALEATRAAHAAYWYFLGGKDRDGEGEVEDEEKEYM